MRHIGIAIVVIVGISSGVSASPRPGGGTGEHRGRLGQVSAGMASAGNGGGGSQGGSAVRDPGRGWSDACPDSQYRRRLYDGVCVRRCPEGNLYRSRDGACVRRAIAIVGVRDTALEADAVQSAASTAQGAARINGYVGAQKVLESDGAFALELAVSDRWFRVGGSLTRFYESQPGHDALTLTVPALAFGVLVASDETTRVYLEGGIATAITRNDPMMDSSLSGVLGGVYAEHALSKHATVIGSARLMGLEDDVRAASLRAGVRYKHVQASFSVLDFNIGPALYGPEVGIGF
jgi:hypothetical protein